MHEVHVGEVGRRRVPFAKVVDGAEIDTDVELSYVLWIVTDGTGALLVDTGFSAEVARDHGIGHHMDPMAILSSIGVGPEQVHTVVMTHLHYDHFCEPWRFPAAEFVVQSADFDHFVDAARRGRPDPLTDGDSLLALSRLRDSGRVRLMAGDAEVQTGVRVQHIGGHTPGSQLVIVDEPSPLVIAGDGAHLYDNVHRRRPSAFVHSTDAYLAGFDRIVESAKGGVWFPGHDPQMLRGLEQTEPHTYLVQRPPAGGSAEPSAAV